ncbi:MAG: TonB family protein [Methylobacterium mesophilicum]|nr:TonB family protein [Methylobacterium mesophilicum]
MTATGFAASESALPRLPSPREAALWGGAGVLVLAAHLAAAYYLRDIEPAATPPAAFEQSMEIELAPLVVDTPEAVQSETLAEAPPTEEALQPEEPAPPIEEAVPEIVPETRPPETVTAETPDPVPPEAVTPEPVQPETAEPVETAEVPPVEEVTPETPAPVIEQETFAATPDVEVPLPLARPEAVRPEPKVAQERPRPRRARPVERREEPARAQPAPRQQARSEASQAQRAPRAPTVSSARWQAQVVARIRRFTRRPAGLRGEGTASVTFTFNDSGAITSVRVTRSSGNPEIDAASVAIVQRSSPVPVPPEDIPTRRFSVPVRFNR